MLVMSMNKKFIVKGILMVLLAVLGSYVIYNLRMNVDKELDKIDFNKYKKVMFVAHPDDEMLWGGGHLIKDDYLVVCVTCGTSKARLNEFESVMKATDDSFIALGYPDKTNGKRNEWTSCYDSISKDIKKILDSNDWEVIVTHNEKGEYGHIHHVKTNEIVTNLYDKNEYDSDLYYFGEYYSKSKIGEVESTLIPISLELLEEKEEILKLYESQAKVVEDLSHMNKYEMWKRYNGE